MKLQKIILLSSTVLSLSGCLMTRNEIEEVEQRKVVQQQVTTMQKTNADAQSRFTEVNEDLRAMSGRIEALENRITVLQKEKDKAQLLSDQQLAETNKKVLLLQEESQKLETQVAFLNQELVKVAAGTTTAANAITSSGKKEDQFQSGEDAMNKKEWREAILHFQKYRELYPKGKRYPNATFKIGQAFYELGMKDEAKTFFEEMVTKFPENPLAKQAKDRLKKIR